MNKTRNYIAYGSNLNIEQMRYRCPTAQIIGTAEVKDYRLLFKGSKTGNYLTIEPERGKSVPVVVWSVTQRDEQRLDHYEGYPVFYRKELFLLCVNPIGGGEPIAVNAFAYIMDERRTIGIPSDRYYAACAEGYENFGFDLNVLDEAYAYSYKNTR